MSPTVLFTGATSIAGRRFVEQLRHAGYTVVPVSRNPIPGEPHTAIVDLAHRNAHRELPDESFDVLVHFAAHVPLHENDRGWDACSQSLQGTAQLLRWAEHRVQRVVLASSCAVYGSDTLYTPTDELHPLRPDSPYAVSKYGQEQLVQAFCRQHRLPLVVLRLGYVYGPDVRQDRAVVKFLRKIQEGEPITLCNSRTAGLHLIHQEDIARIGMLLSHGAAGVYNLASFEHISLWNFVETAMEVLGKRTDVRCEDDPTALRTNYFSHARLYQDHHIRPSVTLAEGIETMVSVHFK